MSGISPPCNPSSTEVLPAGSKRLRTGVHARISGTSIPGTSTPPRRQFVGRHATDICLTSDIIAAFVGNNAVLIADIPGLIGDVYAALSQLGMDAAREEPALAPFVPANRSIRKDRIICLVCGHPGKSLKKHLRLAHQCTPDEYRRCYGLTLDYPMVAPEYAMRRREIALRSGLGRHGSRANATSRGQPSGSQLPHEPSA